MSEQRTYRLIVAAGGTGGHIFPAVAVATAFQEKHPGSVIQFVGARDRMEMQRVPAAGFPIEGLWISGLQRRLTLKNLSFPFKLWTSVRKCFALLKQHQPDAVLGFGGYASGPMLWAATRKKIPTLIQEQNSYAGLTNKLLAKRVTTVCTAYDHMEAYFPPAKSVHTGNPVRGNIVSKGFPREEAREALGLDRDKPTLLVVGGSLGARTLNRAMQAGFDQLLAAGVQFVWQCGKYYHATLAEQISQEQLQGSRLVEFVDRMDLAYAAADVVVSRAGALSISELCLVAKPSILVPSPNVAEDHQTKNAMRLVEAYAAVMVTDAEAEQRLVAESLALLKDTHRQAELSQNARQLAKPNATQDIVSEVEKLLQP